ncbi:MAG: glycine--tRNA ligase subunit beta [Chloroflexota bacterium]
MSKPLNFQQIILTLQQYWADKGFTLWQPYHETVGAGTANPGTILRVLGPEPWNIAYAEPSFRPDDGRYGDNPNRMQMHFQFQVIIQPDPGNPQELYLGSLEAIGLNREEHDIRFVEDNWESPLLGAWGLGWEVWLDGMEISQYTYFQQSGGVTLDPVAVELTYGLERLAIYLQGVSSVWELDWDGTQTYGDILLRQEIEHCIYDFETADIAGLTESFNFYEKEAKRCLENGLVIPAHDYALRCSHTFNILDTRGAVGVTERAAYFGRVRRISHDIAKAFVEQRAAAEHPLLKYMPERSVDIEASPMPSASDDPADFLLEIGSEELPWHDLLSALDHLKEAVPALLADLRLTYDDIYVSGTPRRQTIIVDNLTPRQPDLQEELRGPAVKIAFDGDGNPTKAAQGFARGKGVDVADLVRKDVDGTEYVFAIKDTPGRPTAEVLSEALPDLIKGIGFGRGMRWLASAQVGKAIASTSYSRPLRWFVALLDDQVVPFEYAGLNSGRTSRGLRPEGSPEFDIPSASAYRQIIADQRITLDFDERRAMIKEGLDRLAAEIGGTPLDDDTLLDEVTNLVEQPTPFVGSFDESHLSLPAPVLITVMKKHQRYFPIFSEAGDLLPHFLGVRNGGEAHLDTVRAGNEGVLLARYADADFFLKADTEQTLADFLPRLDTLTFQKDLGSMLDKTKRLEKLTPNVADSLGLTADEKVTASRAAQLCKADLATQMVVEFTNLQGTMGQEYALRAGESQAVATAIREHYLPAGSGDDLPETNAGLALSIANRLDSLTGLIGLGLAPTGSADPFALRREALGLVTLLLDKAIDYSVAQGVSQAAGLMPVAIEAEAQADVIQFVQRRLEGMLRERGLAHDVVQAVLVERGDNPALAFVAANELTAAVAQADWDDLLNAYARCVRLVRNVEDKYTINADLLTEEAERSLYDALTQAQAKLAESTSLAAVIETVKADLVGPINAFFDNVLVMADDEAVKQNRLALLQGIRDLTKGFADFSELQGF